MDWLIWGGAAISVAGLGGLVWCIVRVWQDQTLQLLVEDGQVEVVLQGGQCELLQLIEPGADFRHRLPNNLLTSFWIPPVCP